MPDLEKFESDDVKPLGLLGQKTPPKEIDTHRELMKQIVETGMKGLGFGGGTMGFIGDLVDAVDYKKTLSPMRRLHEYRSSPDYKGPKPAGDSMEETQRLREKTE